MSPRACNVPQREHIDVVVDLEKRFQRMEGFGTCLISWGDFPGRVYTDAFVDDYRNRVGLSMLRLDLSGFEHAEVNLPEQIEASGIEPSELGRVSKSFARRLRAIDPNARLVGTVWSPPAWMKANRAMNNRGEPCRDASRCGNRVAPNKQRYFVRWLVATATWFRDQGLDLYAVSIANEPRFSQPFYSCVWTPEAYAQTLIDVRAALDEAGLESVLLFGPEDMTDHLQPGGTSSMVRAIAERPEALAALDRFASHGYTDGVEPDLSRRSFARFAELVEPFEKPYWMTEAGTLGHEWPEPITRGLAHAIHAALTAANASAFLPWQISEDEPVTHGIMVRSRLSKKTYAGLHYFRTIPTGAWRIQAQSSDETVTVSAYHHPTTERVVVVVTNPTSEQRRVRITGLTRVEEATIRRTSETEDFALLPPVKVNGGGVTLDLPRLSIATLTSTRTSDANLPPGSSSR